MSKHTPGPWTGAGPNDGASLPAYTTEIITDWTDYDGTVESICTFPIRHFDSQNEANARLIAAAPDLLKALQQCLDLMNNGGTWTLEQQAQARAAIAKAEGKEEQP